MYFARYKTIFHDECPDEVYGEIPLKDGVGDMLINQFYRGLCVNLHRFGAYISTHYSCYIEFGMKEHAQMPHICYNQQTNKMRASMLPYQVYVPTTRSGLEIDVFPGVFVYFEQKVEDTRAKFGSSVGAIGTFSTNNRDELMNHSVSIHVPFGCFLVLRADVLRSIVFEGNEMFLCFWINNGEGLQTTMKNMDTIIP